MIGPIKNNGLIKSMESYFVRRGLAVTARDAVISTILTLPGLRGFWPMSSVDDAGYAYDLSGQGRVLTYNGNPTYNINNLAAYIALDGTGDYLSRADESGLDVLGTETTIASALRGITVGGWFMWTAATAVSGLISKGTGTDANYCLELMGATAGDPIRFFVGSVVSADLVVSGDTAVDTWYFCAGRYVPSTSVDVYLNDVKTSETATIAASVAANANPFNIGAISAGSLLSGRAALCFLCAAALPDWEIRSIYHSTRALFGVR